MGKFQQFIEIFRPENPNPLAKLPENHPHSEYIFTLIGYNGKVLTPESLLQLGFLGQVRNSLDHIVLNKQMLFRSIQTVVEIASLYNIPRIRKYSGIGTGIEWEGNTREIYTALINERLFTQ